MASSRRRSLVSQEAVDSDSDFSLVDLNEQGIATARQFKPAQTIKHGNRTQQGPEVAYLHPLDDLDSQRSELEGHSRSDEVVNARPEQDNASLIRHPVDPSAHVYWRGLGLHSLAFDIIGILIPIGSFVLGVCVANLEGRTPGSWSTRVIQTTKIAPSLWPILFSGVLGTTLRVFADWRVERGASLMDLEQLLGSLTMAGSVVTVFRWSLFTLSSVGLILLWALNPLGSQASFRGIYLQDRIGIGAGQITFANPDPFAGLQKYSMFQPSDNGYRPIVRALYTAAAYDIVARTQYVDESNDTFQSIIMSLGGPQAAGTQAAMDPWGNVRIPHLEYLDAYNPDDPYQWLSTPWTEKIQGYSSLLGDVIQGVDRNFTGNTSFTVTSTYQRFNCSPWFYLDGNATESWSTKTFNKSYTDVLDPFHKNDTVDRTAFIVSPATPNNASYHPPLYFGICNLNEGLNALVTQCDLGTTYIDAQVTCTSRGSLGKATCGVGAVRRMLNPPTPPDYSLLDSTVPYRCDCLNTTLGYSNTTPAWQGFQASAAFHDAFSYFLDQDQGSQRYMGLAARYVSSPLTAFDPNAWPNFDNVDIKDVEKRLSLLYNTLWKAGWMFHSAISGNLTASLYVGAGADYAPASGNLLNTTSKTSFPLEPMYTVDLPWLIIYFISVGVMFIAAVASLVLHYQCHAPPILGYVNSLVWNSKWFDEDTQGNSSEDSAKKAKRLGAMKVMVADVKGDEAVGKIAFAPMNEGMRIRKNRWYE